MTTWKIIKGFPLYEINESGIVRSWRKKIKVWRKPYSFKKEKPTVLTGTITKFKYIAYILRGDNNKPVRKMAHKLVAEAFFGDPPTIYHTDVAHNDGNPLNNHISNLRWATHRENQMDMRKHGTMQDGEKCKTSKLSEEQVKEIIQIHAMNGRGSGAYLANKYGVSRAMICKIVKRKTWKYLHCS
jgi:hypothetical protein